MLWDNTCAFVTQTTPKFLVHYENLSSPVQKVATWNTRTMWKPGARQDLKKVLEKHSVMVTPFKRSEENEKEWSPWGLPTSTSTDKNWAMPENNKSVHTDGIPTELFKAAGWTSFRALSRWCVVMFIFFKSCWLFDLYNLREKLRSNPVRPSNASLQLWMLKLNCRWWTV